MWNLRSTGIFVEEDKLMGQQEATISEKRAEELRRRLQDPSYMKTAIEQLARSLSVKLSSPHR